MIFSIPAPIIYPESDGHSLAGKTIQFRLIATIHSGLDLLFINTPCIFGAGGRFCQPVEDELLNFRTD